MRVLFLSRTVMPFSQTSMGTGPLALLEGAKEVLPDLEVTWALSPRLRKKISHEVLPDWISLEFALSGHTWFDRFVAFLLTPELVELVQGPFDLILSNHVPMTPVIAQLTDTPVLNLHMWTGTQRYMETHPSALLGENELLSELEGMFYAKNVFESELQKSEVLASIRPYVNESVIARHAEEVVLPLGLWVDRLDQVREQRLKRSEPALFWGGDIQRPVKGFADSQIVMERAMIATGAKATVSTARAIEECGNVVATLSPMLEVEYDVYVQRFYELMGRGDVFACNCTWESYGLAWLEMLGAGMLGAYMDSWWLKFVLPPWYPFVASDMDEQTDMVIALLRQYPDGELWQKYGEKTREWVRETQDQRVGGKRLADVMREMVQ